MFIAVNANKPPSPFGGADEQVAIYPSSQLPLLRTEKVVFCCSKTINISPPTGRRQSVYRHASQNTIDLFSIVTGGFFTAFADPYRVSDNCSSILEFSGFLPFD
jgi:hypothetical protein